MSITPSTREKEVRFELFLTLGYHPGCRRWKGEFNGPPGYGVSYGYWVIYPRTPKLVFQKKNEGEDWGGRVFVESFGLANLIHLCLSGRSPVANGLGHWQRLKWFGLSTASGWTVLSGKEEGQVLDCHVATEYLPTGLDFSLLNGSLCSRREADSFY